MGEQKVISLDDLLSINDTVYGEVKHKGRIIRLASINSERMSQYLEEQDNRKANVRLVLWSMVDEDGNRIGGEGTDEQVAALRQKSPELVHKLVAEAKRVNDSRSKEDAKNDSDEAQPDASSTDSH